MKQGTYHLNYSKKKVLMMRLFFNLNKLEKKKKGLGHELREALKQKRWS
jgi:hypothetical protein